MTCPLKEWAWANDYKFSDIIVDDFPEVHAIFESDVEEAIDFIEISITHQLMRLVFAFQLEEYKTRETYHPHKKHWKS